MDRMAESSPSRVSGQNHSTISYVLTALVGCLLGVIFMLTVYPQAFSSRSVSPAPRDLSTWAALSSDDQSSAQTVSEAVSQGRRTAIVTAVEQVSPAVVSIVATQVVQQSGYATLFDDPFFGGILLPRSYWREVPSAGSGVIVGADGYIVTNAHVVQNARRVRAVLTDGRTLECKLIGIDDLSDLAVLRVEGVGFPAARLGRSSDLMVGEWVIALGNPLGLAIEDAKPAVTVGVVSALGRDFTWSERDSRAVYRDMIQTDASINPGNSGGPLVNALGEVIGLNTFIISESGGSEGIGFAIPIDRVKRVMDELIRYGKPRMGWTGLTVTDITEFLAEELSIENHRGVLVSKVAKSSPAARAGVRVMDIIREINGRPVANLAEAQEALYGTLVGDKIALGIERNGRRITVELQIAEG
jgi:serine protease Do